MNVLILTPDRVGSTLLQRLITLYMLRREFDQPVINLHELTNGLIKYHHPELNQEILGKGKTGNLWNYDQSLDTIIELLDSAAHYKTARLAQYHIEARGDPIPSQLRFYEYLNNNFYIISCRRENVLEHALSWAIHAHSKKLNVFKPIQKINTFAHIYRSGIRVDKDSLLKYLDTYKRYIEWSDRHFNIQTHFNYDQNLTNIEQFILDLPFMHGHKNNTWQDMFGQSWQDFNTVHRMLPNIVLTQEPQTAQLPQSVTQVCNLPVALRDQLADSIDITNTDLTIKQDAAKFLQDNLALYKNTTDQIATAVKQGYMISNVPIKLQSLSEKMQIITNFTECVEWSNDWVRQNNLGKEYTTSELLQISSDEESRLQARVTTSLLESDLQT